MMVMNVVYGKTCIKSLREVQLQGHYEYESNKFIKGRDAQPICNHIGVWST